MLTRIFSIRASGNGSEIPRVKLKDKHQRTHPTATGNRDEHSADQLPQVDHVPSNTHSSQGDSKLYIFEDNEAVIKMIIESKESNYETCCNNPQSFFGFVV